MSAFDFIYDVEKVQLAIKERDKNIKFTYNGRLLFRNQTFTDGNVFRQLNLQHALFIKCTFQDTEFKFVRLRDAIFSDCLFRDVTFYRCDCQRASFSHCDLLRCHFRDISEEEYDNFGSNFRDCTWPNNFN